MTFLRYVYASLIVSGCCITVASLSSPSLAGEIDSEVDFSDTVPEPLENPLLLAFTSGTCLGLMARLNASQRQLHTMQMQAVAQDNACNPMTQVSMALEFSESDVSRFGLEQFLEAEPDKPTEESIIPVGIMAEYACI